MAATVDNTFYRRDNPFMDRLIDSVNHRRGHKRQRSACLPYNSDRNSMALFASATTRQHLVATSSLSMKRSERNLASRNEVDDYLTSDDLETSFASNVSLNSPPHRTSGLPDCEPMDISPMPPPRSKGASGFKGAGLPRVSNSRLFGSDLSNSDKPAHLITKLADASKASTTTNKKLNRSALPLEWMATMRAPIPEPEQVPTQPSSPMDDAMDVDTSFSMDAPPNLDFSSPVQPTAPGKDGFTNLFYDTQSPRRRSFGDSSGAPKKRRSLSPEGSPAMVHHDPTSSPAPPSPSVEKFDRMAAAGRAVKPCLPGLGVPSANFLKKPRRPMLSEVNATSAQEIQSAYPLLSAGMGKGESISSGPKLPPVRRSLSAMLPPPVYTMESEADSSFDGEGPDMSSPAQAYSKRQQGKTIRRRDGTDDFRPLTAIPMGSIKPSPATKASPSGIPGFGDNEAHGKILPCHRVREDGLMRITPQTLNELLDGKYDHAINDYHVIDCRFDYEYAGGHIQGAVNINTTAAIEELLLGPSLTKPRPSTSGDSTRKTVLVFHCEFSAKRAPTFAKHLRAKDRAMNNHTYPKIHYPEVYILEGGYCGYFKVSGHRCDPPNYVTMDDPNHATARREDLDQFRKAKFGRHKSYAYGDNKTSASQLGQPRRSTAPNPLFAAAASAVRSRRTGSVSLGTLEEDPGNTTLETEHEDTDTDIGDSPCPPPTKAPMLNLKAKKPLRSLVRSETFNPSTRLAF